MLFNTNEFQRTRSDRKRHLSGSDARSEEGGSPKKMAKVVSTTSTPKRLLGFYNFFIPGHLEVFVVLQTLHVVLVDGHFLCG